MAPKPDRIPVDQSAGALAARLTEHERYHAALDGVAEGLVGLLRGALALAAVRLPPRVVATALERLTRASGAPVHLVDQLTADHRWWTPQVLAILAEAAVGTGRLGIAMQKAVVVAARAVDVSRPSRQGCPLERQIRRLHDQAGEVRSVLDLLHKVRESQPVHNDR